MQTLSTKKKSNSREMPWNRYRDSTVGRNRCWKMLVRMALGSSSIISCCFKCSVLNWRHICDNIWSFSLGGRWFRLTKFEAACMLFLCQKSEPNLVYRTYNFPRLQSTKFDLLQILKICRNPLINFYNLIILGGKVVFVWLMFNVIEDLPQLFQIENCRACCVLLCQSWKL